MTPKNPLRAASWILEHMVPGGRNEALAGDLLEEFRSGRSEWWYWRQVLAAMMTGCLRAVRRNWLLVFFSFLWTVPAPVFWIHTIRWQESTFLTGRWGFNWPYSTMCDLALTLLWHVLYVWAGVMLGVCIFSVAAKAFHRKRLMRALWSSLGVYILTFAGFFAWRMLFPMAFVYKHASPALMITLPMVSFRVPFFIAILAGLWLAGPPARVIRLKAAL